jgi:hypothetical protein
VELHHATHSVAWWLQPTFGLDKVNVINVLKLAARVPNLCRALPRSKKNVAELVSTLNKVLASHKQPEEKIEFSFLMHEIKVLPLNYSGLIIKK